jgi:hypothetical protein
VLDGEFLENAVARMHETRERNAREREEEERERESRKRVFF